MVNRPKVLVIDVGGTNVKLLATGQREPRKFPSGAAMTPEHMVREVKKAVKDWDYDVVSIGYPGPVVHGRPLREPVHPTDRRGVERSNGCRDQRAGPDTGRDERLELTHLRRSEDAAARQNERHVGTHAREADRHDDSRSACTRPRNA